MNGGILLIIVVVIIAIVMLGSIDFRRDPTFEEIMKALGRAVKKVRGKRDA